jgi:hypothetical protein
MDNHGMREGPRREVLRLVGTVVVVDLLFIAAYFLARLRTASSPVKVGFTVLWTLATLGVVVRGLPRLRSARISPPPARG